MVVVGLPDLVVSNDTVTSAPDSYCSHLSTRPSPSVSSSAVVNAPFLVELGAIRLTVPLRRHLDSLYRPVGALKRPRVSYSIICPRKSDSLQLLVGAVVFPPIDLAVFVRVYLDALTNFDPSM